MTAHIHRGDELWAAVQAARGAYEDKPSPTNRDNVQEALDAYLDNVHDVWNLEG